MPTRTSVCLAVLLFVAPAIAWSAEFSETLKSFVLGEQAEASTLSANEHLGRKDDACMQCHNGSSARGIAVKSAGSPMHFIGHTSVDHPVGMSYAASALRDPGSYVPPAMLDHRIELSDGRVGCVSCHQSPAATRHSIKQVKADSEVCSSGGSLTIQNGLCLSCHRM